MPDLDNIHYKFFPKSQTAPYGKRLIVAAWVIEIIVASLGLSIAYLFYKGGGTSQQSSANLVPSDTDTVIVALVFVVVSVVELTKIPLASAFYYAARIRWKLLFFLALFLINVSTFETIIQGLELNYYQRGKEITDGLKEKIRIHTEIEVLTSNFKIDKTNADSEGNRISSQITEEENRKAKIKQETINQITALLDQVAIANPRIPTLNNTIKEEQNAVNKLRENKAALEQKDIKGDLFGGKKRNNQINIKNIQNEINIKTDNIKSFRNERDKLVAALESKNQTTINALTKKEKIDLASADKQIEELRKQEGSNNAVRNEIKQNEEGNITKKNDLNIELIEAEKSFAELANQNQIARFAFRIKTFNTWLFSLWSEGNKKSNIQEPLDINSINAKDLNIAFLLWFGTLAFVISVTGTLIALAGLHLKDERMHEIRNRPIKHQIGKFFQRIGWIPLYVVKVLWAVQKRLLKPKIVKEKVEVEVEKIVKEPVYHEKIVYKTVEVPKEVIRKEIVHHPLWTDDPDLINKEPFTAPKDKKDRDKK